MEIIKPPKLKKGDLVTVVSPSQPISNRAHFWRGVKTLENLGFQVIPAPHVEAVYQMYKAGTAEERAQDLNEAFANKKIKAIFMSIGGYLANEVLPLLDYSLIKKNPKIIVGFSDGTTILNALYARTGLVTFHGFSIQRFFVKATPYTVDSFLNIVQRGKKFFIPKTRWQILKKGKASGRLVGGNLLCFANLLGTRYFPDIKNSILFLEEHDDYTEEIENALRRLANAGIFSKGGVKGVIFGKMVNITIGSPDPETRKWPKPKNLTLYRILKDFFQNYRLPVLANVDFGAIAHPLTIPIGIKALLDLNNRQIVFCLKESAVK